MTAPWKDRNVFRWRLDQEPQEVGRARDGVRKALAGYELPVALVDDVELVVSELVTNSIVHGAAPVTLTVQVWHDRIRVCVTDASPQPLVPRQPDTGDERGRGLAIVTSCSAHWWVCTRHPGKDVWAEFHKPAAELPSWLLAAVPGQASYLPTSIYALRSQEH
ncbi:ATP-binding protein [Nonomuraea typhae]|uniref:ATP-binding protein n=1 Tax=Nonomuraea typhae TaxID=2603600 RepID=A0ABW7Z2E9_9ACTN